MWSLVVVLTVAVTTLASGYWVMNSRSFTLTGHVVHRVDTSAKVVALTFDDGPTRYTPDVLRMLDDAGVRATFYLTGGELTAAPQFGTAIAAAGHEIGNHSYSHRRMVLMSPATVADEIERTDAAIRGTGYQGPITFRPPYGKKLWTLPRYLSTHERTMVTWDVEPDSTAAGADAIVAETVSRVRPGSIILLHAMYDSRDASRAAVPQIIDELRSAGYRFVTGSELLASP
ncbi:MULTISPECIES: polysaccharide deacetylase family protein [unclassified Mycolicibacterium]|uniref:polysaccharide deacetylase family protein n=1 Tax=unclassified Mycolicibacterium TaxID=2636767 RepID=UPI0012DE668A|nr:MULTISPECIES: polysaccharide deacetylase family protein [unclassified Mycolicibacterium]MUL84902.1 polysaccharide deacetylase family protein [Mycolicibacterium sp. CBMA 329]MUL90869.1 polysaccharide deacetylase family protein [Mycolicibacterium sp. CBMA 331]MUM01817.1 polysaccharide deacetylase family protein [Mycolicibacterium sp. CBMA 334]MUM29263.1 polysaccharide deacetylase family protein [Mycolicibacterium sp. CBMA 295]MUM40628.1 polysaccharide deacetylase family protein [Mycolicibacte